MTYTERLAAIEAAMWEIFWYSLVAHILLVVLIHVVKKLWVDHAAYKKRLLADNVELAQMIKGPRA